MSIFQRRKNWYHNIFSANVCVQKSLANEEKENKKMQVN